MRQVLPGLPYAYPPTQGKLNPETATAQECKRIEEDAVSQGERLKRDAEMSFELQSATARRRFEREVVDASIERARKEIEARLAQDASLRDKLIERSIASFEL